MKDYYKILSVSESATPEQIKSAYRKLAHLHHSDKGGSDEKMKEINEAYECLKQADKRAIYDNKLKSHTETQRKQEEARKREQKANRRTQQKQTNNQRYAGSDNFIADIVSKILDKRFSNEEKTIYTIGRLLVVLLSPKA